MHGYIMSETLGLPLIEHVTLCTRATTVTINKPYWQSRPSKSSIVAITNKAVLKSIGIVNMDYGKRL